MPKPAADLDEIDRVIGRNIRFHRLRRELSQAKLAARIDMSYQQLQKYERSFNRISASRLLQIAQVLETPIAIFFEPPNFT
jgi:transcriptional regulator with XRE-family HTH domain